MVDSNCSSSWCCDAQSKVPYETSRSVVDNLVRTATTRSRRHTHALARDVDQSVDTERNKGEDDE